MAESVSSELAEISSSSSEKATPVVTLSPAEPVARDWKQPRIGILVVAYNAENTLRGVLHRIPEPIVRKIDEIFIFDDASSDNTAAVGRACRDELPHAKISVFRNPVNLMYGGNQARGYIYAMEQNLDIVVLLHGDGQYAPEVMQDLLTPLEKGEAECVMGSRMMVKGAALKGNMPMYKYVGNKILTYMENKLIGTKLSEFHSGYRAYSVHALKNLPLGRLTYNWHFDTQIIIELLKKNFRIKEVPIPTYYGDEICHVNGVVYAMNCVKEAVRYCLFDRWKRPRNGQRDRNAALPSPSRPQEQSPADLQTRAGAAT